MTDRAELLTTELDKILLLETTIGSLAGDPAAQQSVLPVLAAHRDQFVQHLFESPIGLFQATNGPQVANVNGETVYIATVQHIYQTIYGRDPTAEERRR